MGNRRSRQDLLSPGPGWRKAPQGGCLMTSCIYTGNVTHQRHWPKKHRLSYRVFSLFLNLDELDHLGRKFRLFGYNSPAIFSFHDKDHGDGEGTPLRQWVNDTLASSGSRNPGGPVYLFTYPRMFGYVFNPISVYFCYDRQGELDTLIYEVGNTWGERHCYIAPVSENGKPAEHSCDKNFFVSPFLPMDCRYHFQTDKPGRKFRLLISETSRGEHVLDAWFSGKQRKLDDRSLMRLAATLPFMTLKIIAGIHWEALKIWFKGVPVFRHVPAPKEKTTLADNANI
jgi:DUF1365 family protein